MKKSSMILCGLTAVCLAFTGPVTAQNNPEGGAPSIVGSYVLVSRDLPDGSEVAPPEIQGMITFTETHRNFNVYWKNEDGQPVSISYIAKYELTGETYTEECLYHMSNNMGAGLDYQLEQKSGSTPVEMTESGLKMKFPLFDEPMVEFHETGFSAWIDGAFVDHWKKVE